MVIMVRYKIVSEDNIQGVVEDFKAYKDVYEMEEITDKSGAVVALGLESEGPRAILDFQYQTAELVTPTMPNNGETWQGYMFYRTELPDRNIHYLITFTGALSEAYEKFTGRLNEAYSKL